MPPGIIKRESLVVYEVGNVSQPFVFDDFGNLIPLIVYQSVVQTTWIIDSINGNDSNDGLTLATAIKTDAERQRRMGPNPLWDAGAYHIRYINDLPLTDPVRIVGMRARNSCIFLHGSMVNGEGQSILRSGTITALTVLDNTTAGATTSWQITDAGIPVSWTASGLVGNRIRLTSGNIGAKSFAIKDLGAKQARCDEFLIPNVYTFPFTMLTTQTPPVNGNTYVVEKLTVIPTFYWNIQEVDDGSLNFNFIGGVIESLDLGSGDFNINGGDDFYCFDGCKATWFGAGVGGNFIFGSTGIVGTMIPGAWQNLQMFGGHYIGQQAVNIGLGSSIFVFIGKNFIFQSTGGATAMTFQGPLLQFEDVGFFDIPSVAMQISGQGVQFLGKVFGTGNASRFIHFFSNARSSASTAFAFTLTVAVTPHFGFFFNGALRTSIPAFDPGTNTYTADRTCTIAHFSDTIAAGGFNKSMLDPVSGSGMVGG